ncbi:MAG: glycosyltransferase [Planctomycetes bacterium]|nr:glycosyltransferase [Planctomycetota bacterium]
MSHQEPKQPEATTEADLPKATTENDLSKTTAEADLRFSLIIPAFNCYDHLKRLLDNLQEQSFPCELYEIIVVDDGSTDNTASISESYPVRLVSHSTNLGRVQARESGAKAAKCSTLVFVDTRLTVDKDMLKNAVDLDYLPLMGVGTSDKYLSAIDRVFYCIRRRTYYPYEPQFKYAPELWLKENEFDGRPKGTGLLIIDRSMFLDCALKEKYQDVNDDTKLLKNIVTMGAPILRHTNLEYTYEHRHNWSDLLKHTFFRGPKFLDYYLVPGGPLFGKYITGLLLLLITFAFCLYWPILFGVCALLIVIIFTGTCIWMSEDFGDFFTCLYCFPPIAGAFIGGITFAQITRLFKMRTLIRH